MKNNLTTKATPIDTILETKPSGCLGVENDLKIEDGKSIAQLIHEQEKQNQTSK